MFIHVHTYMYLHVQENGNLKLCSRTMAQGQPGLHAFIDQNAMPATMRVSFRGSEREMEKLFDPANHDPNKVGDSGLVGFIDALEFHTQN